MVYSIRPTPSFRPYCHPRPQLRVVDMSFSVVVVGGGGGIGRGSCVRCAGPIRNNTQLKEASGYSVCPQFGCRPGNRLSWLCFIVIFLSPAKQTQGWYFETGHDPSFHLSSNTFLMNPCAIWLCVVSHIDSDLKCTVHEVNVFWTPYVAFIVILEVGL
jgi:hypothetical protein